MAGVDKYVEPMPTLNFIKPPSSYVGVLNLHLRLAACTDKPFYRYQSPV
jgi:hypothetical protein